MCGISGFCNFTKDYTDSPEAYSRILNHMQKVQAHRGPDDHGSFLSSHVGLSHARLSIIDLNGGHQPMTCTSQEYSCTIVYNGELYNTRELHKGLKGLGISFETASDTEVILRSYMEYGPDFVQRLNGIFAFAIWDPGNERLVLYRDRSGIKPLFYTIQEDELIFASEIKAILAYPCIKACVD